MRTPKNTLKHPSEADFIPALIWIDIFDFDKKIKYRLIKTILLYQSNAFVVFIFSEIFSLFKGKGFIFNWIILSFFVPICIVLALFQYSEYKKFITNKPTDTPHAPPPPPL